MVQTVKLAGVEQRAFFGHRCGADIRRGTVEVEYHRLDVEIVFGGEFPVALVMTRYGHHGTGAVLHQHEVSDPDRNLFARQRMDSVQAGGHAFLLHRGHVRFGDFGVAAFSNEVSQRRVVDGSLARQRMTGCHGDIGCPHEGVRTGGVNRDFFRAVGHVKGDLDTFRTANPVALHGLDLLRPVFQLIEVVEQLFGVIGDFHEPLRDLFAFDFGVAAPAAAIDHLFVRQYGLVVRAPVDCGGFFVDQTFFVQFGEEPLFPAVILRLTGRQFATPVIAEAQQFQLVFHVFDVVVGPGCWRGVVFHRRPFSGQAKGIPANRLQDVFAQHALVARNHIANGVVTHVAHVQAARRIGQHRQAVVFIFAFLLGHFEGFVFVPVLLDAGFYLFRAVLLLHGCLWSL